MKNAKQASNEAFFEVIEKNFHAVSYSLNWNTNHDILPYNILNNNNNNWIRWKQPAGEYSPEKFKSMASLSL